MFVRSLKAKIAFNLAVLLLMAMSLIVLVTMVTVKRELIKSELSRANTLLASLKVNLLDSEAVTEARPQYIPESFISKMINESQISGALLLGNKGDRLYLGRPSGISAEKLAGLTRDAIVDDQKKIHYFGTSWSIFWQSKAKLVLSTPLIKGTRRLGGISIVLSLDRVHFALKRAQQLLLIYIFINLIILTFVGIHRVSKLYLEPLTRLAKRAADYTARQSRNQTVSWVGIN